VDAKRAVAEAVGMATREVAARKLDKTQFQAKLQAAEDKCAELQVFTVTLQVSQSLHSVP
jgi:hypothetical protein